MSSLKSFIKSVRAAKTLADERAVIQKESAAIRTSFRENYTDSYIRRQNVSKLLYLFTLGERTHFGQVECLKLLATSRFTDKRLGYLGTMLLLDENQEVLTLVTNSLSNDLAHSNQYVVALALCTLGNIASQEMARDLFAEIEKILSSSNPYLKKKAALCALRIVQRVPDLEENFVDKAKLLLNDKNHGVLLCGAAFITDLVTQNPDLVDTFRTTVPTIIKHLKALSSSGYAPEHDVLGIADPFLQVKLLRLLGLLGAGDAATSEMMSDILAQIASNTDPSKNIGSAVLYEAVRTIFAIEADSGLRVLGVNILGKFLSTKDNNSRYVALNTLLKVIEVEPTAVQRHRAIIIECLQDGDVSIRRRALELSYALINDQNIRVLVRELLSFLETADVEFKANLVSQIAMAAERYAPNKRWHIDTLLRALKLAGAYAKENVLSSFITLVVSTEDLQLYAAQKLYAALRKDFTQEGLNLVGAWVIGEYANVLLQGGAYEEEELVQEVRESDIVDLLATLLESQYATELVKEYAINALIKLSTRISSAAEVEKIRRILSGLTRSLNVEVQQRVSEYSQLFKYDELRRGVLEKMPPPEIREDLSKQYEKARAAKRPARAGVSARPAIGGSASVDLLLDLTGDDAADTTEGAASGTNAASLLDDIFSSGASTTTATPAATAAPAKPTNQNILDLFGDSPSSSSSAPAPAPTQPSAPAPSGGLDDIFGGGATPAPSSSQDFYEALDSNGLVLSLAPTKDAPGSVSITAKFENRSQAPISKLNLQVAVPKSQKLQIQGPSSHTISPGETATQLMKVTGKPGGSVRLRLKVSFAAQGQDVQEMVDFSKFPPNLL